MEASWLAQCYSSRDFTNDKLMLRCKFYNICFYNTISLLSFSPSPNFQPIPSILITLQYEATLLISHWIFDFLTIPVTCWCTSLNECYSERPRFTPIGISLWYITDRTLFSFAIKVTTLCWSILPPNFGHYNCCTFKTTCASCFFYYHDVSGQAFKLMLQCNSVFPFYTEHEVHLEACCDHAL